VKQHRFSFGAQDITRLIRTALKTEGTKSCMPSNVSALQAPLWHGSMLSFWIWQEKVAPVNIRGKGEGGGGGGGRTNEKTKTG